MSIWNNIFKRKESETEYENEQIEQLEKEIAELEVQKQKLIRDIQEIDDMEEFATGETYTKSFLNIFYKRLPINYISTIYHTKCDSLLPRINATFDDFILHLIEENLKIDEKESTVMTIAMHCDTILSTDDGPVLILSDPYKTIKTKPLTKINYETTISWVGRILLVKIIVPRTAKTENTFEVKGVTVLKYTLNGVMGSDGKETNILPNTELFSEYSEIKGYKQCVQALNQIEKYLKDKGYLLYREDEAALRFRKDDLVNMLIYKNDRLEYIYKKDKPLNDFDLAFLDTELGISIFSLDPEYEHLF